MVEISEVAPTSIVQAQDITNNCAISGVSGNMIVSKGDASAGESGSISVTSGNGNAGAGRDITMTVGVCVFVCVLRGGCCCRCCCC